MCGIAGYISLDGPSPERIAAMVSRLEHRGPDAQTVHLDGPVGLGHARLSIIDLAGGHQPLFNEDRSIAVVCNGEIYNYRELRAQLAQRGHQFRTNSDCEVLAHLWEESGREMTAALRGMFAFVLYDRRQGIVFGARDRFGQKPLYYFLGPRGFAFASEIKSLLTLPEISRAVDRTALDQFLFNSYIPSPRTLFAEISKLPAAHWLELRLAEHETPGLSQPFQTGEYWQAEFNPDAATSDAEHLTRLESALEDAVRSHLVSDVPVGVFLSGGIDSSLITALAARHSPHRLQTFSIGFPGSRHDESPRARLIAQTLQTDHHEFPFEPKNMPATLTEAARLFDQPLADTAVLPLLHLSRETAKSVKVVLTGDGGDELFAGYRKYKRMAGIPGRYRWLSRLMSSLCPPQQLAMCAPDPYGSRKLQSRLMQVLAPASRSEYRRDGWEGWERHQLYQPAVAAELGRPRCRDAAQAGDIHELAPLNAALRLDQGPVLADRLLLKGDYATMACGLEARAPLLDHQLARVAGSLPMHLKATSTQTKVALREIARRHLPAEIVEARKKGFSMPLDQWLRGELKSFSHDCLLRDSVSLPRFFRREPIERLLAEQAAGRNHAQRIYGLIMLELWCREYL